MKVALCLVFLLLAAFGSRSQLYGPNRAQTISNIFQIPIQTLTAISNVAQNTRPLGEVVQRRRRPVQQSNSQFRPVQQSYSQFRPVQQGYSQFRPVQQSYSQFRPVYRPPQVSRAARVAGLYPASDGSFFRI